MLSLLPNRDNVYTLVEMAWSHLHMQLSTFGLNSSLATLSFSLFQGQPRTETTLPSCISLYSNTIPNTSNQTFGSRVCTELGKELMRMDKLLMLTTTCRKTKASPEMQPCWRQGLDPPTRSEQTQSYCRCVFSWGSLMKFATKQAFYGSQ